MSQNVGADVVAKYSCDSTLIPTETTPQEQTYKWQFNGEDLTDGSFPIVGLQPVPQTVLKVTSDQGDDFEIDFEKVTSFEDFVPNRTYTITPKFVDVETQIFAIRGSSAYNKVRGSSGGSAQGTFTFVYGETYLLQVGNAGGFADRTNPGATVTPGGLPGGGDAPTFGTTENGSGGGGGYTGLFKDSVSHSNSIMIAGGGGGSTWLPSYGGDGGGFKSDLDLGDVQTDDDGNILIYSNASGTIHDVVQTGGKVQTGTNTCLMIEKMNKS